MSLDRFAQQMWYERRFAVISALLLPLAWVFDLIVRLRRAAYGQGWLPSVRLDRPVVVVGNLTVGGTGKTPLVVWLANECAKRGVRAAIVCRGYGGSATSTLQVVTSSSDPRLVGDEAVLMAGAFAGLVIACADRVAAARYAIEQGTELILCDDGLQHYRLARDAEILVVDGSRGFGNARLLPAGPLREAIARGAHAQLLVRTMRGAVVAVTDLPSMPTVDARMVLSSAVALASSEEMTLAHFRGRRVHAIAAVGNPAAFFEMLREQGLEVDARALPDHAAIAASDVEFGDGAPVLMTEKDAVKCRAFADERLWYVPLRLEMGEAHQAMLWDVIQRVIDAGGVHH